MNLDKKIASAYKRLKTVATNGEKANVVKEIRKLEEMRKK